MCPEMLYTELISSLFPLCKSSSSRHRSATKTDQNIVLFQLCVFHTARKNKGATEVEQSGSVNGVNVSVCTQKMEFPNSELEVLTVMSPEV